MYCDINKRDYIDLRLTYINIRTYQTVSFEDRYSVDELYEFFHESIIKYMDWLYLIEENKNYRIDTIKSIKFPFDKIRDGQRDLMKASYYTLSNNKILYAIAPTGIGKTIANIFSGIKALKNDKDKLFYLTGKSIGKTMAEDSLRLLINKGLKVKVLSLTAKAKSCFLETPVCDPAKCMYAKGYYDRLQEALLYAYNSYDLYTRETVFGIAKEFQICPFEFQLDLSELCDVIICDYNYVFDPSAHLIRYFDDTIYKPKILIDEAHNLVNRAKDMYSASINYSKLIELYNLLGSNGNKIYGDLVSFEEILDKYRNIMIDNVYYSNNLDLNIYDILKYISIKTEELLSSDEQLDNRIEISIIYFDIMNFLNISDIYSDAHRFLIEEENGDLIIKIQCLDAREFTYNIIKNKVNGTVLFSATMYPINYYMELITKGEGKYLQLASPFNPNNLKVLIDERISTKYKNRENTILDIIKDTNDVINYNKGNYIIYFSSYKYMELFLKEFKNDDYNLIIQESNLSEERKMQIFEEFKNTNINHLGLFVLGGSFSEGLDFVGDLLKGVIIVGVGIPQVNLINNLQMDYFDDLFKEGYDFAYTYPGFSKVIQAAGRVIRSENDKGIVLLIDERYRQGIYKRLMPSHWKNKTNIKNEDELIKELETFFGGNKDETDII